MPNQEHWILRAAHLFPSPTPEHIRTSDIPLVLICLDIEDNDLSIRRALGVGRVREIPVQNLVRVLSPILPAENSASERYTMFKVFDEYGTGAVSNHDLQRVAVGSGLLTIKECDRIMNSLANTSNGITFDEWCQVLKDEAPEHGKQTDDTVDQLVATSSTFNKSAASTIAAPPTPAPAVSSQQQQQQQQQPSSLATLAPPPPMPNQAAPRSPNSNPGSRMLSFTDPGPSNVAAAPSGNTTNVVRSRGSSRANSRHTSPTPTAGRSRSTSVANNPPAGSSNTSTPSSPTNRPRSASIAAATSNKPKTDSSGKTTANSPTSGRPRSTSVANSSGSNPNSPTSRTTAKPATSATSSPSGGASKSPAVATTTTTTRPRSTSSASSSTPANRSSRATSSSSGGATKPGATSATTVTKKVMGKDCVFTADGFVTRKACRDGIVLFGYDANTLSDAALDGLFKESDKGSKGKLTEEEFKHLLMLLGEFD